MENATNALLIAAGVLIAIVIISIGVGLYTNFSRQSKEYSQSISNTEIQKFNSNFEAYIGRKDVTPQEIVTLLNLAKEYQDEVQINVNGGYNTSLLENFLKEAVEDEALFKCIQYKYDGDGRIESITFSKN